MKVIGNSEVNRFAATTERMDESASTRLVT